MTDLTASAVVYGERDMAASVNRAWLDAAIALLTEHGLPVREYEINESPTSKNETLYPWPKGRDHLLREVDGGHVRLLGLYAHPEDKRDLPPWWEGLVRVNLEGGYAFLGLPAASAVPFADLLQASDRLASLIAPFRYGFSYLYPAENGPEWYVIGIPSRRSAKTSAPVSPEIKSQLNKWQDDYLTKQSYLRGSFRDVYPANLLSESHVHAALPGGKTLETLGTGRLSLLGPGKWLWEVSDDDKRRARAVRGEAGLLICA